MRDSGSMPACQKFSEKMGNWPRKWDALGAGESDVRHSSGWYYHALNEDHKVKTFTNSFLEDILQ